MKLHPVGVAAIVTITAILITYQATKNYDHRWETFSYMCGVLDGQRDAGKPINHLPECDHYAATASPADPKLDRSK